MGCGDVVMWGQSLTNIIQSCYWSWLWTKWLLFELLWSLDTAGIICTHVSLLSSYCSRFLEFSRQTLLLSIHTRMKSIMLHVIWLAPWLREARISQCYQLWIRMASYPNKTSIYKYFSLLNDCKARSEDSLEMQNSSWMFPPTSLFNCMQS